MSFNFKITKKNGKEYGQIVEYFYNNVKKKGQTRSFQSFGDLKKAREKNPNFDKDIELKLKELNSNVNNARQIIINEKFNALSNAELLNEYRATAICGCFGMAFYRKLWEQLGLHLWFDKARRNSQGGINYDFDLAVFFLAAMRILNPASKAKTFASRHEYIFDFSSLTLDNIYDCLTAVGKRKDTIIKQLNKNLKNIYDRVETIAFYDVTTFYFESFDSDELRARGMPKENKTNEVQVVLGLLVDSEGIPINYEIFRGNTSEMKTIIEVVNKYRSENGLNKVTVVADRGLNSHLNLKELDNLGFDYIVAQSIDKLSAEIKEMVFDGNWDNISYDDNGSEIFKYKTINIPTADDLNNKIIVTWSLKRQAHDIKVLNERYAKSKELVDKGEGAINASIKHGQRQFIKKKKSSTKIEYETNEALYEKRLKYAGYYALTTSKKEDNAKDIYHDLRQLWHIEECFRVMKTNLDTRPIYVWTADRIRGHFLICYLALVLERLSYYKVRQAGINISNNMLIDCLKKADLSILKSDEDDNIIFMRQSVGTDLAKNNEMFQLQDKLLSVFKINRLSMCEDVITLENKFKVSHKLQLNY